MQITITSRGMQLTDAIRAYAEKKISALSKFYDQIIRANITVGVETNHHLKGKKYICECKLEVPGKDVFASKNEITLYKAIDKVRDYLELELKKHKVKLRVKGQNSRREARKQKEYVVEM